MCLFIDKTLFTIKCQLLISILTTEKENNSQGYKKQANNITINTDKVKVEKNKVSKDKKEPSYFLSLEDYLKKYKKPTNFFTIVMNIVWFYWVTMAHVIRKILSPNILFVTFLLFIVAFTLSFVKLWYLISDTYNIDSCTPQHIVKLVLLQPIEKKEYFQ